MKTGWNEHFSERGQTVRSSAIRELLKVTERPDTISFAGGLPAPELFPIEEFRRACDTVLSEHGRVALQYGATEGYRPLREYVAGHLQQRGLKFAADDVIITGGSQQALDLVGKLFIDKGDPIVVESPSYVGGLQAFQMYGPRFVTVPADADGLRTDLLEEALRQHPRFIYALPNFQNPSGATLTIERRRKLAELADKYDVPIVEDDPYAELIFEGEPLPPVTRFAQELRGAEAASLHLGTFSKTLSPGLRLGWIAAPAEVIRKIVLLKQGTDLHTSMFTQAVAYEIARSDFIDEHVRQIRAVYGERMLAMIAALEKYFPPEVTWTKPLGGMFVWVRLPDGIDGREVLRIAVDNKVAFVPGHAFFAEGNTGYEYMRLNFSNSSVERIEEGIRRLAQAVSRVIESTRVSASVRA